MNRETIMKFKNILEEHKIQLLQSVKAKASILNTNKDDLMDEVDHALADLAQEFKMRMGNREALYLKKINSAFQRILDGSYGICAECGGNINEKRLEARPTAELCIDCKEESEKKESLSAEGRKPKSVGRSLYDAKEDHSTAE